MLNIIIDFFIINIEIYKMKRNNRQSFPNGEDLGDDAEEQADQGISDEGLPGHFNVSNIVDVR